MRAELNGTGTYFYVMPCDGVIIGTIPADMVKQARRYCDVGDDTDEQIAVRLYKKDNYDRRKHRC